MNHFQCKTYIIHLGWLRRGIQFSCNCNINVTWQPEVGVTLKYKWGIMHSIVLYCYIVLKYYHVWALQSVTCTHDTQTWSIYASFSVWTASDFALPAFTVTHDALCGTFILYVLLFHNTRKYCSMVVSNCWTGYMEQNNRMEKGIEQCTQLQLICVMVLLSLPSL